MSMGVRDQVGSSGFVERLDGIDHGCHRARRHARGSGLVIVMRAWWVGTSLLVALVLGACTSTSGFADDLDARVDPPKRRDEGAAGGKGGGGAAGSGPSGTPDEATCADGKKACGPDGGTCVDVTSDPNNCGRCGHSCLGGKCAGGACQPIELTSKLSIPQGLALGPDGVYVTVWGANKVVRVPKGGGPAEDVSTATSHPWGIAVASSGGKTTSIVWGEENGSSSNVVFCDSVPCASPKKSLVGSDVYAVAIASGNAYWTTRSASTGKVQSCNVNGCFGTPFDRVTGQPNIRGLVVSGAQLAFGVRSSGGVIRRSTTAGTGIVDLISDLDNAEGLATDGTTLYAAVNGSGIIARCPLTGCTAQTPSTFALATYPHAVATDGTNVYWANGLAQEKGSISWCPATGCSGAGNVLADAQSNPYGIAVDEEAIYWTTSAPDGTVMKIAKP